MFDEYALENSYSIAYEDYNDEYNIFSSPTIEEETRYDYNMPPIFDDYGDENNYSVEFAPTKIVKIMFMWGVLILLCMWLMIGMIYVIVMLVIFMMLLKVIMREGNLV
jgi:hypothetical protein